MTRKPVPMEKRETICVTLDNGMKLRISNKAKQEGLKLSDIVRKALRAFLGI